MKRGDTMSLGEFRELTKDLQDDAVIMIVSEQMYNEALAVHSYPANYFEGLLADEPEVEPDEDEPEYVQADVVQ